jgi:hypothetical protein
MSLRAIASHDELAFEIFRPIENNDPTIALALLHRPHRRLLS